LTSSTLPEPSPSCSAVCPTSFPNDNSGSSFRRTPFVQRELEGAEQENKSIHWKAQAYVLKGIHLFAVPSKEIISLLEQIVFKLSLQDSQGEVNLVNLVEDWEVLEEYAGDKQGFYQIIEDGAEAVEFRVAIGRLGFKKRFVNKGDALLNRILSFCKSRNYIKVSENVRDEFFFK